MIGEAVLVVAALCALGLLALVIAVIGHDSIRRVPRSNPVENGATTAEPSWTASDAGSDCGDGGGGCD